MAAHPVTLRLRPEARLRSRAARGDAAVFATVYERHHQALYRYCRSLLRDDQDAQDALQSTMTKAFAALQKEERDFDLRPWLFRIAHNEAITLLRQRRGTATLEDGAPAAGAIEDRVAAREELRLLRADLADLPERQRAALVLRELNGLSHAEIGQVLDLTPAGVKQALFDARNSLSDAREGRALGCEVVRRKLSDGDGRVLRGRGVRAHLRSCTGCRDFRAALATRPQKLGLIVPPLPAAGAASLLSQLFGGTAAKLLACVAIAGGGTTVAAVELHNVLAPAREQATTVKPAAATTTAAPAPAPSVTAARGALVVPTATATAGRKERITPAATVERTERPARRRAAATPAPSRTSRSRGASEPAPAAGTTTTQTQTETQTQTQTEPKPEPAATQAPQADRRDDEPTTPPKQPKTQTKTPPSQAAKPAKPEKTNPGKARGPEGEQPASAPAAGPGNNGNGNGNANGNSDRNAQPPAQTESPGNSGNAPGQTGENPGNGNGNAGAGNGNSANAPGHTKPDKPAKADESG